MNKVILIGRLTQNPQHFVTKSNIPYVRFTLAVKREYGSDVTDFVPVVAWRQTATFVNKYITKGSLIAVEGSFTTGRYQNNKGETVNSYDVTANSVDILESKRVADERRGFTTNPSNNEMTFAPNSNANHGESSFEPTPQPQKVEQDGSEESEWSIDELMI